MSGSAPAIGVRPISRGDLLLVRFPFTDLSTTKLRPAVVVWADQAQIDFTVAFVTSHGVPSADATEVLVQPSHPEFVVTGLSVASKIRATKLVTLNRALASRWLGRVGPLLASDLDRALVSALSIDMTPFREEGRQEERRRLIRLNGAGGAASVLADLGLSGVEPI